MLAGYRGYGGNPGSPTEDGLYADARASLDWLAARGFVEGRLVLYGESSALAWRCRWPASARRRPSCWRRRSPAWRDGAASHYPYVPARLLVKDKFDNVTKIRSLAMPLLIVHGERDRVLPVSMGRALLAQAIVVDQHKDGVFLPDAGHNDLMEFGPTSIVTNYLDNLSRPR